ncbi:MAG TPA: ATP-binding protein [Gemmatimonadaceae bacterium]|nr:ATP-binding protein [Gemmatimonadaceae bacterium]
MFNTSRILRWIFIGRLSLATAIFVAAVFVWKEADATDTLIAALALFAAIAVTAPSIWYALIRAEPRGRSFYYAQSLFDLCLITAVVHVTGGAASQFAALYILVSASASLLLPVGGGLLVAALGITLYYGDVVLGPGPAVTLGVGLQLGVFGAVALGTAYLGARLKEAGANREALEAQLAFARLQADDILRNIRSGIITIDRAGRLLYANPAAGAMLGIRGHSMLGQPVLSDIDKTAPALADALRLGVERGQRVTRGEAVITLNGRRFPIGLTTTTMEADRDTHGSLASATVIFQDISDNKRLEELRLRAERLEAVTELSASLAHEIKNPLASIRSAVEQLARVPSATDDERTLSTLIVRESDRLSRLLSEFLDFARVRVTRVKNVDLVTIARAAVATVSAHPDCRARVEVRVERESPPLLVEGDEDLLHRAVFNIALNAVQATPEGRRVTVEALVLPADELPRGVSFGRDAVALRVCDEGPGIPEAIRDRVFDPFFTTKAGGTGLGLPIVHRAIEAHRGLVFLDSSSRGTRFTVLLPRWQPDEQEVACPAA